MMSKMENSNWILWLLGAVGIGGIVYLLLKNKSNKKLLLAEEVDKLTLHFVDDYFRNTFSTVEENNPAIKPVLIKMSGELFENNSSDYKFFGLVYYNTETKTVIEANAKYIKVKSIDVHLKAAFGDKDVIIYE